MLTAALLATKLLLTGIVPLVPSVRNNHLVRVVVPNGTVPNLVGIPSHVAYVMFDMQNLDTSGRQPDVVFTAAGLKFGVCLISQEFLAVNGTYDKSGLCQPTKSSFPIANCASAQPNITDAFPTVTSADFSANQDSLQWLLDLSHANPGMASQIDPDVLRQLPNPGRVALRMDLTDGKMTVVTSSFDFHFAYRLKADGTCQALAKAVRVTMEDSHNPALLSFESTSFDGSTKRLPLKLSSSTGDLAVLIGNEAPADIEESINILRGTGLSLHHGETSNHLSLIANLMTGTNPMPSLLLPAEIPAGIDLSERTLVRCYCRCHGRRRNL